MIDIDFFKAYNDRCGHTCGDEALKSVAHAIVGGVQRSVDKVARYGGEEFIVILPNTKLAGAEVVAEKMLEAVSKLNIAHPALTSQGRITVSVGVSSTTPAQGLAPVNLINMADSKLYEAKEAGRNCWRSEVCQ